MNDEFLGQGVMNKDQAIACDLNIYPWCRRLEYHRRPPTPVDFPEFTIGKWKTTPPIHLVGV